MGLFLLLAMAGFSSWSAAQGHTRLDFRFNFLFGLDSNPLLQRQESADWGNNYNFLAGGLLQHTSHLQEVSLDYFVGRLSSRDDSLGSQTVHSFSGRLLRKLSPRVDLEATGAVSHTPDFTPTRIYTGLEPGSGVPPEPGPDVVRAARTVIQAGGRLTFRRTALEDWVFSYGANAVRYSETGPTGYGNSMEHRLSGGYRRHLSPRLSLGVDVNSQRLSFLHYSTTWSESALAVLQWKPGPSLTLEAAAGPIVASISAIDKRYAFINARAQVEKSFRQGTVGIYYSHDLSPTYGIVGAARSDSVWGGTHIRVMRKLILESGVAYARDAILEAPGGVMDRVIVMNTVHVELSRWAQLFVSHYWSDQDSASFLFRYRRQQVLFGVSFILPALRR